MPWLHCTLSLQLGAGPRGAQPPHPSRGYRDCLDHPTQLIDGKRSAWHLARQACHVPANQDPSQRSEGGAIKSGLAIFVDDCANKHTNIGTGPWAQHGQKNPVITHNWQGTGASRGSGWPTSNKPQCFVPHQMACHLISQPGECYCCSFGTSSVETDHLQSLELAIDCAPESRNGFFVRIFLGFFRCQHPLIRMWWSV